MEGSCFALCVFNGCNPERVRANIRHHYVFERGVAFVKAALNGCAKRYCRVRIDMNKREAPEQSRHQRADHGHSGRSAHQDNGIELVRFKAGIQHGAFDWSAQAAQERGRFLLERAAANGAG